MGKVGQETNLTNIGRDVLTREQADVIFKELDSLKERKYIKEAIERINLAVRTSEPDLTDAITGKLTKKMAEKIIAEWDD